MVPGMRDKLSYKSDLFMPCHLKAVWSQASYLTPQLQQPYLQSEILDRNQMKLLIWDSEHRESFMEVLY